MMFAQVNSEHCRHKIFNAEFTVDGETQPHSLFQMIKMTYAASPQGVLSAYKDNASVIEGHTAMRWFAESDHVWRAHDEPVHILMKVETHNHPTDRKCVGSGKRLSVRVVHAGRRLITK